MPASTTLATPIVLPRTVLWGTPAPAIALWKLVLADRQTDTNIADVTTIQKDLLWRRRLGRAAECHCRVPANDPLVNTIWSDGYPALSTGRRVLMLRFRLARDATGNATFPTFTWPQSGPAFLRTLIRNSISNSGPVFDSEGGMGLDVEHGTFDYSAPDMTIQLTDWPTTIADIATLMISSGGTDTWVDPVDTTTAGWVTPGTLGMLNSVGQAGNPSSIVHFDYGMGDYSIDSIRRSEDMDTVINKLRYLLGKQIRPGHWLGSIEATNLSLPNPPQAAINAAQAASRAAFHVMQSWRVFDDNEDENDYRVAFGRLWQNEALFRAEPREMLFITPSKSSPFRPTQVALGDEITINVSNALRRPFSGRQRAFGYDVTISENGSEGLEELVTSADGLG
jgi:hypothetical protein